MKFFFLLSRLFHLYSPQFDKVVLNFKNSDSTHRVYLILSKQICLLIDEFMKAGSHAKM